MTNPCTFPSRPTHLLRPLSALLALTAGATLWLSPVPAEAKERVIGTVDTVFKLLTRDDDIIVEAFDDPVAQGVTCYVSRARTGGVKGSLGLAEDKSEASISCHQVAPVSFARPLKKQESVFSERLSILFKRLHVVRMVDPDRNTLVYLTYSDKVIDGSPKNSVAAVPIDVGTPIPLKK
ncbi:MAG: CreA family protein [Lautropia sp.]|nr:CreA family protein [Lautropia sp.]